MAAGTTGLLPAPSAGTQDYFICGDGTWRKGDTSHYFLCKDGSWKLGQSGQYFLRGDAQWATMSLGKPITDLGLGDLVKFGRYFDSEIIWEVADKNHSGFPSGSITLVSKYILMVGDFDAAEPNNPDSQRKQYGNNDYTVSNVRQWLNSSAQAGQWYTPQHTYDQAPNSSNVATYNQYANRKGFLADFTAAERALLLNTSRVIACYSGNGTTCTDKVFLPTITEYGASSQTNDGSALALYTSNTLRKKYPTQMCVNNNDYSSTFKRVTNSEIYLTATSWSTGSSYLIAVSSTGSNISQLRSNAGVHGICPACNLPSSTLLSLTTDSDGCYTVLT